ncbi:MAG TPA: hypothetical protein VK851_13655, partial [Anaerolineales bacterium]|nr:hypothetical protein [Anaerolineales bacterium]
MSIKHASRLFAIFIVLAVLFASCTSQRTPTPQVIASSPTPVPTREISMSTPAFTGGMFSDAVPQGLKDRLAGYEVPFNASLNLDVAKSGVDGIHFQWVYALVAPFPTVTDGVTFVDLRTAWDGNPPRPPFSLSPLLMADSTLRAFTALWGEPADGSVRSVDADRLLDTAWDESAWAIVPFESLEPQWKVLTVDGQSPIRKGFNVADYPLIVNFTLESADVVDSSSWALSNYDSSKLTTVIMTGVTALVRATAVTMELKGSTYPGQK